MSLVLLPFQETAMRLGLSAFLSLGRRAALRAVAAPASALAIGFCALLCAPSAFAQASAAPVPGPTPSTPANRPAPAADKPSAVIPIVVEESAPKPAQPAAATAPATPAPAAPAYPPPTKADQQPSPHKLEELVSTDAPPPLVWKWSHFSTGDYVVSLAGGAVTLASAIVAPRSQHSIKGGILFDDSVRNALRAKTIANRYVFRDASDVGLSLSVTWPFMADALTAAWWYRGSRDAAQEMALIDLQTLAVVGAVQGATNVLVSRERPYGRDCGTDQLPSKSIDCANSNHYRSFFSGHAAFSFAGAALICTHHFETDLLGPPWDALSCAGGYAVAATTATFRVVSDMHYASDVLTGALVGTLFGYGVPLLHYSHRGDSSTTFGSLQLNVVPEPGGVGIAGIF